MIHAQAYFDAARELATLRQQRAQLQTQLDGLVTPITQAEALTNKTRDALLRQVEAGQFKEAG
jgi:hypothetical protein